MLIRYTFMLTYLDYLQSLTAQQNLQNHRSFN